MNTEVKESRSNYVVKANELIQRTRYSLTTNQQKILLFAVSKIRPDDEPNTEYIFTMRELCQVCGMDWNQSQYYRRAIESDILKLMTPEWCKWVKDGQPGRRAFAWIENAFIPDQPGNTITIKFKPEVQQYLFGLQENYTQYKLEKVLAFTGKYTIRLYEILRSYTQKYVIKEGREWDITITLERLREQLQLEEAYPAWYEFKRNVLDKSIQEINQYNDEMTVSYYPIRKSRCIASLNFVVEPAKLKQKVQAHQNTAERLDKGAKR